jgi:hypothetical protein
LLPDPLAGEVECRDVAGPVFTGKVYATREDAVEALSWAAVRVGREAARLPPLADTPMMIFSNRRIINAYGGF